MNQADVSKLVSKLRINIGPRNLRLRNPRGPPGRLDNLRQIVTGLVKYERLEVTYTVGTEARNYAERLISDAIRHGDCHAHTMEMVDFWLQEKQLVHKMFKVLVPRFKDYTVSYTRILRLPSPLENKLVFPRGLLELRGNPFPPIIKDLSHNKNLLHNILLDAAKKDYRKEQYLRIAQGIPTQDNLEKLESCEDKSEIISEKS